MNDFGQSEGKVAHSTQQPPVLPVHHDHPPITYILTHTHTLQIYE